MGKAENDDKMEIKADIVFEAGTFLVNSVFSE